MWCGVTRATDAVVETETSLVAEVDAAAEVVVGAEAVARTKFRVRRSTKPSKLGYNKDGFKMRCDQDQVDLHYGIKPPHKVPHTKYEITLPRPVRIGFCCGSSAARATHTIRAAP